MNALDPVQTREACTDWLSIEDVEREAFAAMVAAKSFSKGYAFMSDSDVPDGTDWPDAPEQSLGWLTPSDLLVDVVRIFSARLQTLAVERGVAISCVSGAGGDLEGLDRLEKRYGTHMKGKVQTITDADIKAMPPAQRKAFKEAVRTGKVASLPKAL